MALHKHTPEQRELMKKAQAKKKAKPAKKGLPFAKIGKKKTATKKTLGLPFPFKKTSAKKKPAAKKKKYAEGGAVAKKVVAKKKKYNRGGQTSPVDLPRSIGPAYAPHPDPGGGGSIADICDRRPKPPPKRPPPKPDGNAPTLPERGVKRSPNPLTDRSV